MPNAEYCIVKYVSVNNDIFFCNSSWLPSGQVSLAMYCYLAIHIYPFVSKENYPIPH